jgi:hypothetical protein
MQKKTEIHQLLRDFRDLTGAQLCSIESKRGTRVYVGRPTTLSAEELVGRARGDERQAKAEDLRRLTKTTLGWNITVEFESQQEADQARGSFEDLVDIIEELVSNDLEPLSSPKPASE